MKWKGRFGVTGEAMIGSIGELLVEFVCAERDGGNLVPGRYLGPFPSGAPGIFIDQAALVGAGLGVGAVFAGAVGDDAFGLVLRRRLAASGVSDAMIVTLPGAATGSAFVSYNTDGSRDFVFNIAGSAAAGFPDGAAAVDGFLTAGVRVFHTSGSTLGDPGMRARVVAVCEALVARGVVLSFDPNLRKELMGDTGYLAAVQRLVGMAGYVLPSDADAEVLFPGEAFTVYAAWLLAGGARAVVLKRGDAGCVGMDARGVVDLPGHRVDVVDPTGAGDCFCATFVALSVAGYGLCDALERANAAGALAVGALGPMEGNSDLAQIEAFLAGRA